VVDYVMRIVGLKAEVRPQFIGVDVRALLDVLAHVWLKSVFGRVRNDLSTDWTCPRF
jgi:hypothetical protein